MIINSFLFLIILNLILIGLNNHIAKLFNLYDVPNKRKIHKNKIPLTGGLIIMFNIIFHLIFINKYEGPINIFENNYNFYLFLFTIITIFVFGILDDKFVISANTKFILIILILFPIIFFDKSIQINTIKLSFIDNYYDISPYGVIWTLICFLLLMNAINMFDGINLQVGLYFLTILLLFISKDYYKFFFLVLIIGVLSYLYLNFRNVSFLGDGGAYVISFIIGYFFIKMYNSDIFLYADQIALIMIIPGLDLMRLFTIRILNKKHPFSPDNKHLHHLLLKKFSYYEVIAINQGIILMPFLINLFFLSTAICFSLSIIIYFYVIYKLS